MLITLSRGKLICPITFRAELIPAGDSESENAD
jgi:hypothetical protein